MNEALIRFWENIRINFFYSTCQKNVPVFQRFFLQPLTPQCHISEHNYAKRYKTPQFKA